ncbi:MAG TPA: hypothetical protein G4O08_02605 [Anaerolineae bacterium]|nr:hypothetical protein [Anaerolineae bacterium]
MAQPDWIPIAFLDDEIEVLFEHDPLLSKRPHAPDGFVWGDQRFDVIEVLSEWVDTERRGRAAKNMSEAHLRTAARRGSWGVGRFYFRVRTDPQRVFDLYYDRSPKGVSDRHGHWVLWRELRAEDI